MSGDSIRFTVPGRAQAWQRAGRATLPDGTVRSYTQGRTEEYEGRVKLFAGAAARMVGWRWHRYDRFELRVTVYRADTHHFSNKNAGDNDNFHKAVSDALNGVLYHDDRCVMDSSTRQRCDPHNPRTEVELVRLARGEAYVFPVRPRAKRTRRTP